MNPEGWSPIELTEGGEGGLQYQQWLKQHANDPQVQQNEQLYNTPVSQLASQWWQQNAWDFLVGAAAVGGLLIGLWMMAGSPKPEVIPVPA